MAVSTISPPPFGLDLLHGKHFGLVCAWVSVSEGRQILFLPRAGVYQRPDKEHSRMESEDTRGLQCGWAILAALHDFSQFQAGRVLFRKSPKRGGSLYCQDSSVLPLTSDWPHSQLPALPEFPVLVTDWELSEGKKVHLSHVLAAAAAFSYSDLSWFQSFKTIGNLGTTRLPRGRHLVLWRGGPVAFCLHLKLPSFPGSWLCCEREAHIFFLAKFLRWPVLWASDPCWLWLVLPKDLCS